MSFDRKFLVLLNDISRSLDRGVSLGSVARQAGVSPSKLHREFRNRARETLKHFTLRLQLERAAARLVAGDEEVRAIALTSGFASHEVFTRAFRRHFGVSPSEYRRKVIATTSKAERLRHLALTKAIGPCIRFFHQPLYKNHIPRKVTVMPTRSISRKVIEPQHVLYIRRRIAPSELKDVLGECFGKLFAYGAKSGLPIAGWPLCRYASTGMGLWTVEPAMPLASPAKGEGEIKPDILPGGPVVLGIHAGPYENLPDTNAAIERWIEANGYEVKGFPWEVYASDPAENPDPKDWRTEVYWPLAK